MSNQSASSRHTGKSHRSAQSLRTREDLKIHVLKSRIASLEAEGRTHEMAKPNVSRHCQVIAKLAAKKAELDKLLRRRSTDLHKEMILLIYQDTIAPGQAKRQAVEVTIDLGNLQPPFSRGSSSSTQMPPFGPMPIRKGIVEENWSVFFQPPAIFVIGDETMFELFFESTYVMETVLGAAQPVKGTMSSDTPRAGRSMIPTRLKHVSRGPVKESSRKKWFRCQKHKLRKTLLWRSSFSSRETAY